MVILDLAAWQRGASAEELFDPEAELVGASLMVLVEGIVFDERIASKVVARTLT